MPPLNGALYLAPKQKYLASLKVMQPGPKCIVATQRNPLPNEFLVDNYGEADYNYPLLILW